MPGMKHVVFEEISVPTCHRKREQAFHLRQSNPCSRLPSCFSRATQDEDLPGKTENKTNVRTRGRYSRRRLFLVSLIVKHQTLHICNRPTVMRKWGTKHAFQRLVMHELPWQRGITTVTKNDTTDIRSYSSWRERKKTNQTLMIVSEERGNKNEIGTETR